MNSGTAATATILFTDLVGSTALRVALGEDRADEVRRVHDRILGECVRVNGGRVVKGGGDGLLAAFDAASGAVSAAVRMQQAIAEENARPGRLAELSVRIGLSAGDVLWEDGDCFGTPVVEAARLEAQAQGGQILCSDIVRSLSRGRGGFVFADFGDLDLKGLPEPVRTYEVRWSEGISRAVVPLPSGLMVAPNDRFVGRSNTLTQLLDHVVANQAAAIAPAIWLTGEPGIGKTRLAAEVGGRLHAQGWTVLFGRSDEALAVPYQPFAEALRHIAIHMSQSDLAETTDGSATELAMLCPELANRLHAAPLSPGAVHGQYSLFEAIRRWLERLAEKHRVLLVLDDLQWATGPTLLLVNYLARTVASGRFALLVTVRDTECPADLVAIMDESRLRSGGMVLTLRGLDADAVAELTEDRRRAEAVVARTAGNPLFVRSLIEDDQPGTLDASVRRRVGRLSPGAQDLLRLAALSGLTFEHAVVARAAGLNSLTSLGHLEETVQAGLVDETGGGSFRFNHALVRDALDADTGATRRQIGHRALANAIETIHPGDAAVLARHWTAAANDVESIDRAVTYLCRAGDAAIAATDYDGAARAFAQALELLGEGADSDVATVSFMLGRARLLGGSHSEQTEALLLTAADLAEGLRLPALLVEAVSSACFVRTMLGIGNSAGLARVRQLAEHPPDDPCLRVRARAYLANSLGWEGHSAEAAALGRTVLTEAAAAGDALALAFAHTALALFLPIDESRDAADHGVEAMRIAPIDDTLVRTTWKVNWVARALVLGDLGACRSRLAECRGEADRLRHPFVTHAVTVTEASIAFAEGDLDRAEALVDIARVVAEGLDGFDSAGMEGVQEFSLRREQARLDEVAPAMRVLARLSRDPHSAWRPGLAAVFAELGMPAEARSELEQVVVGDELMLPDDSRLQLSLSYIADAAAVLGDGRCARIVYERMRPWSGLWVTMFCVVCYGPVDRYLGMLALTAGDLERAEAHLRDGLGQCTASGAALYEGHSNYWLARTAVARGDAASALAYAGAALGVAERNRLPSLRDKTEKLLAHIRC